MASIADNLKPELWSTRVIENLDQINLALPVMANTNYEGEIRRFGDTVHVRTLTRLFWQPYASGGPINYAEVNPTDETLVIDRRVATAVDVDDVDRVQHDINLLQGYTRRMAVGLSEEIDRVLFTTFGTTASANRVSNSGSAFTVSASNAYTLITDAMERLDLQNCPQNDRWVIISPTYKKFLLQDSTYLIKGSELGDMVLTAGMTARQALGLGFVGQIGGANVWMSTNLPVDASGKYVLFGQGKPVSFAMQFETIETVRRENSFSTAVRALAMYGLRVFNEDAKRYGSVLIGANQ